MFKLINGLFYSEHFIDINHDKILADVLKAKNDPDPKNFISENEEDYNGYFEYEGYEPNHTFYEDSNLYKHTFREIKDAVDKVFLDIFKQPYFECEEMWGHVIEPNYQTMIHNHGGQITDDELALSWVYYPHHPAKSGNIIFTSQVNTSVHHHEVKPERGKLLIFSKDIYHYTPLNASKYTRVAVSGNHIANRTFRVDLHYDVNFESPYWKYSGKQD